jgi:hypothetical protein
LRKDEKPRSDGVASHLISSRIKGVRGEGRSIEKEEGKEQDL